MGSAYFMPLLDGCWGVEYEPDQAEEAADTAAADTASPILAPHELQKRWPSISRAPHLGQTGPDCTAD